MSKNIIDLKRVGTRLAAFVREQRKKAGLTQEELADRSGIDYKHIQNIESMKKSNDPKLSSLVKIAHALKIDVIKIIENILK